MMELSIALGVVGLAAVLAAWDAMRRAIGLGAAEARLRKELAEWGADVEQRVVAMERANTDMVKDVRALKDQLYVGRR